MSVTETFRYKAEVKKRLGAVGHDTARLRISVGRPYHEGTKLEAALEFATSRYKNLIVSVSDTLQVPQIMLADPNIGEHQAFEQAEIAGTQWIERNSATIKRYKPDAVVTRFKDYAAMPEYAERLSFYKTLAATDASFDAALSTQAEHFTDLPEDLPAKERARRINLMRAFALAELPYMELQHKLHPADDLYCRPEMPMMQDIRAGRWHGMSPEIVRRPFVRFDFSRRAHLRAA